MINFLSSWIKSLSLALIIVSILEMLLPNSKTKKYVKMVMGLYILFTIIAPFIDTNKFNFDSINADYFEEKVKTSSTLEIDQSSMDFRLKQLYQEQLETDIKVKLKTKGYEIEKCTVIANISNDDSKIEKITIKVRGKDNNNNEEDKNNGENNIEKVIVKEIQKVKIGNQENKDSESTEMNESSEITKTDMNIIKNFLIEEYGVSENCLKIS